MLKNIRHKKMSIQLMTAEEFHSKFSENIKNMLKFMKLKIQT